VNTIHFVTFTLASGCIYFPAPLPLTSIVWYEQCRKFIYLSQHLVPEG